MSNSPSKWIIPSAGDLTQDPDLFPILPGQGLTIARSPLFSTRIYTAVSGRERRSALWPTPRWLYTLGFEVLRDRSALPELAKVHGFFCRHAGRAGEFFLRDGTDSAVSGLNIGTGDGVRTVFYLAREVGYGSLSFLERVMGTLGDPVVSVAGSPVTATLGAYGRVTLASPPALGAAVTWAGVPLRLVRFDTDQIDPAQMTWTLWALGNLKLRSVVR